MLDLTQMFISLTGARYLILFPLVVVEGPIISVVAGFMVAQAQMNFWLVYLIVLTGDLLGDIIYYILGRWGRGFKSRLPKNTRTKLSELERHFHKHSGKTVLMGKIAHGVGTLFILAAGAAHMPFNKFLAYSTLGSMPKSLILILVGYFFGHSFVRIGKYFDLFGLVTLAIGVILLVSYILFAKKIKQKEGL